MKVSVMQSHLQQLKNGFSLIDDQLPEPQKKEILKSFVILESNLSKLQKKIDKDFNESRHNSDPGIDTGMEYCGTTEDMY